MTSVILAAILLAFIRKILFAVETLECRALDLLYKMFRSFAGITPVYLNHKETTLLDVFFSNDLISTVYWGMACIGFALTFGFAITALIRKIFDSTGEKVKATIGQILLNTFKSFLLILLMTAIVSATITGTTTLLTAVDDLFNNAAEINSPSTITFDDEDFANMFKILDTIGSHAISPGYNNRFNLNSCFNEIRTYMQELNLKRVFDYSYVGAETSWQYALTRLYHAGDIYKNVALDTQNEEISSALLDIIEMMKTNKESFKPLKSYTRTYSMANAGASLGRVMMLSCSFSDTSSSGSNDDESTGMSSSYNEDRATFEDALRRPYYVGEKDIYSWDDVTDDFSYGLTSWNHFVNILGVYFLIKEFLKMMFNCIARIFNMMVLYVVAPPFISVMPLDDGGKFKQWTTAFIIQSLSIFGSVIAVRVLMIMIPVVLSPNLMIFSNSASDIIAKDVIVMGMCLTCEKANGMIGGILSDQAGYQSVLAGEVGGGIAASALSLAGKAASVAGKAGAAVGKGALSAIGTASGITTGANKLGEKFKNWGAAMKDKGGIVGAHKGGWTSKEQDQKAEDKAEKDADKLDTDNFRTGIMNQLGALTGVGGKPDGQQKPEEKEKPDGDKAKQTPILNMNNQQVQNTNQENKEQTDNKEVKAENNQQNQNEQTKQD